MKTAPIYFQLVNSQRSPELNFRNKITLGRRKTEMSVMGLGVRKPIETLRRGEMVEEI
jgi:hypothetical protein